MAKVTTTTALAKELGCARSTLYYHPKQPASDEELKVKIISVMTEHPAYGSRRVAWALRINRKAAQRVMRLFGLKPQRTRGQKPRKLDDMGRSETMMVNILKTACPLQPNVIWAGDFTYLWFQDRFWYVATVIDVYTREIVGWHVGNHHTSSLVTKAFQDAVKRVEIAPRYFHSDQGSEYVSGEYDSLLKKHGTTPSHSRKSSPWQNGFQESFYSQFKLELGNVSRFEHIGQLIEAVHQQIMYYNDRRIHSALKMPPTMYKQKQTQKYAVHTETY